MEAIELRSWRVVYFFCRKSVHELWLAWPCSLCSCMDMGMMDLRFVFLQPPAVTKMRKSIVSNKIISDISLLALGKMIVLVFSAVIDLTSVEIIDSTHKKIQINTDVIYGLTYSQF